MYVSEQTLYSLPSDILLTISPFAPQTVCVLNPHFGSIVDQHYRTPSVPPEIHVAAKLDANNWVISIGDNGTGFEPQYADRIFGLFKPLHTEEYAGTGLGLAICKRIVERYGGRMWAESVPGKGSTFYFTLPQESQTLVPI